MCYSMMWNNRVHVICPVGRLSGRLGQANLEPGLWPEGELLSVGSRASRCLTASF